MDVYQALTILTFVTSTVTMILVAVAVLPHVKQGMVVIRDAILWVAFVLVVAVASWLGWQRIAERFSVPASRHVDQQVPAPTQAMMVTRPPATGSTTDAFYRGPVSP